MLPGLLFLYAGALRKVHHASQCISNKKLSEKAKALCTRLHNAGYSSAKDEKAIESDMRKKQAYKLMSEAFHNPRIIDGETSGWAVGGHGGLAPATHRRHL